MMTFCIAFYQSTVIFLQYKIWLYLPAAGIVYTLRVYNGVIDHQHNLSVYFTVLVPLIQVLIPLLLSLEPRVYFRMALSVT